MTRPGRAVASAVSTILLVAVAVILTATISVVVLDLTDKANDPGPQIVFDVDKNQTDDKRIVATHKAGDVIPIEELNISNGEIVESSLPEETLEAGDSFQIVPNDDVVRLRWEGHSTSYLLHEIEGPFDTDLGPLGGSTIVAIIDEGEGLSEGDEYNQNFTIQYYNESDQDDALFKVFAQNESGDITYITTTGVGTDTYPYEYVISGASASDGCYGFYDGTIVDINDDPDSRYDVEIEIERDC